MKTLIQSTLWVPDNTTDRYATTIEHVKKLLTYTGEFNIYFTDNDSCSEFKDEVKELCKNRSNIIFDWLPENKGWNWARNLGFKKAWDDNYDLLILMDCDIWVEDLDWVEKSQEAAKVQDVFMVRFEELQYKVGEKEIEGIKFDLYDEGIGSINVVTRKAIEKVGGLDTKVFDNRWGFSDCHMFRRYLKAGFFKKSGTYPSLHCNAVNGQDFEESYAKVLDPIKHAEIGKYATRFYSDEQKILLGMKPVFFNWEDTFK